MQNATPNEFVINTIEYKRLKETINILKKQQDVALRDIERLRRVRDVALHSPTDFVQQLLDKRVDIPLKQTVFRLPYIPFDKFLSKSASAAIGITAVVTDVPQQSDSEVDRANLVPIKSEVSSEQTVSLISEKQPAQKTQPKSEEYRSHDANATNLEPAIGIVRGRTYTPDKPVSFNRLWTKEEQKRLEELLVKYPDEPISSRRWAKIAEELGDRTPRQVASRTQKYFIKLAKEGKPIPGRMPNMEVYDAASTTTDKDNNNNNNNNNKRKISATKSGSEKPMTETEMKEKRKKESGQYYMPPQVYMSDDSEEEVVLNDEDLKDLDPALKDTEEYKELVELIKIQKKNERKKNERIVDKPANHNDSTGEVIHEGFKCDSCEMEPIVGVRWTCSECPEDSTVDLCSKCYNRGEFNPSLHNPTHKMVSVEKPNQAHYFLEYNYEHAGKDNQNYLLPTYFSK